MAKNFRLKIYKKNSFKKGALFLSAVFALGLSPQSFGAEKNQCLQLEHEYLKCNLSPAQLYQLREFKRCQRKNSDDSRTPYCQNVAGQKLINLGATTAVGAASILFGKFGSPESDKLVRKIVMNDFLELHKADFITHLARRLRLEQVQKYPLIKDPLEWKNAALNEIESLKRQIINLESRGIPIKPELRSAQNRNLFGLTEAKNSLEFAITSVEKLLAKNITPRVPQVIFTRAGGFDMTNASLEELPSSDQARLRKQAKDYLEDYVFHAVQTGLLEPDEILKNFMDPTDREAFSRWKAFEKDPELMKYAEIYRHYDEHLKKLYKQKRIYTVQEERKIFSERASKIEMLFPDFEKSELLFKKYSDYSRYHNKFLNQPPKLTTQGQIIKLVHEELSFFVAKNPNQHHGLILKFKIRIEKPPTMTADLHPLKPSTPKDGVKMLSLGVLGATLTVGSWMEQNRHLQWACDQEYPGLFTQYQGSSVFNPINCQILQIDDSPRAERYLIKVLEEPYRWSALFKGGESCLQLARHYENTFCN